MGGLDSKPNVEALHWHHQLNRSAQRGKILSLDHDPHFGATGGLIYNVDTGERAIFSRAEVFLFGTCLAKMDLNYVLSPSDKVKLVTEPIHDPQILKEHKEKYGGLEVYRAAKLVWVGETPKWFPLGLNYDETRFLVDKNLNGLCQYLNKRNVDVETFAEELVTGVTGKMSSAANCVDPLKPLGGQSAQSGQASPYCKIF